MSDVSRERRYPMVHLVLIGPEMRLFLFVFTEDALVTLPAVFANELRVDEQRNAGLLFPIVEIRAILDVRFRTGHLIFEP